jgi:DNA-binding SARP family transcriptional activator/tetratricopeptide (TPR) repeat protein
MEFRLLGPVEVHSAGRVLDPGRPQQSVLLAALSVDAGRLVPVDALVDRVWGDGPPERAQRMLHTLITRIRALLRQADDDGGAVRLIRRANGYLLDAAPEQVDLHRFRQVVGRAGSAELSAGQRAALLRDALALWRGEPLAGLAGPWVDRSRLAWEQQRVAARVAWATAELDAGNPGAVVDSLVEVAHHSLVEPLTIALMRAFAALGRSPEALACYANIRARLADELGVDPGPELQAVHGAILRGELRPLGTPDAAGPAAGSADHSVRRPAHLPAATPVFVGRDEHLGQLDKLVYGRPVADVVTVAAVVGTAGIGKTALAVHWAHRVKDQFPDGQLFVNLRGFDPAGSPVPPGEAVRGFLDALRVPPSSIPASLDGQVGMYRSELSDRRVLILLDNARDAEQVLPLLPGAAGCLVLVTSRSRLTGLITGHAAHTATLGPLPADEAGLVLERRLGADRTTSEPEFVGEIVDRCGGLPLALAIVAARVVADPVLSLEAVARELRGSGGDLDPFDGGERTADLRAVFSWSYDTLSDAASRLFRLLALHPGPDISTPAAASLAGTPVRQAAQALAELARAHLIDQHTPGRFRFHDLIRALATELVAGRDSPEQQNAATHRMLDHYLHTAGSAAEVLWEMHDAIGVGTMAVGAVPERVTGPDQAREWLIAEHPVLLRAIALAGSSGFDRHVCQLAWTVARFLERRGLRQQVMTLHHAVLAAAQRLDDKPLIARAHRAVGVANAYLGDFGPAQAHWERAVELYGELADPAGQAHTYNNLAWLSSELGRPRDSMANKRYALELFRAAGDQAEVAGTLGSIGWSLLQLGDAQGALGHCEEALALLKRFGKRHEQGAVLHSLGLVHHQLGDYPEARRSLDQALSVFQQLGDRVGEAETLVGIGDTHLAGSDVEQARAAWSKALAILEESGHPDADEVRAKLTRLPRGG